MGPAGVPSHALSAQATGLVILRESRSQRTKGIWEKQCSEWGKVLEQEFLLSVSFYDGWKFWEIKPNDSGPCENPSFPPMSLSCGSLRSVLKSVLGHQSPAALVMDKDGGVRCAWLGIEDLGSPFPSVSV